MDSDRPSTIAFRSRLGRRLARIGQNLGQVKVQREARRLKHQLWLHSQWWLRRHTPYRAIFVLATPRSGSNLLIDYLNRMPGVYSLTEVLSAWLPTGPWKCHTPPAAAIRHLRYSLQTLKTPARGCKVMLEELDYCRLTVDTLAEAFPESKFLILYRQSLAQQYVSLRADLAARPERWTETLRLYGVPSEASRRALDEHWQHELAARPELRAELDEAVATYTSWLRGLPR